MTSSEAREKLALLSYRLDNGPNLPGYDAIKSEATDIICCLLDEIGCEDISAHYRDIINAPLELGEAV